MTNAGGRTNFAWWKFQPRSASSILQLDPRKRLWHAWESPRRAGARLGTRAGDGRVRMQLARCRMALTNIRCLMARTNIHPEVVNRDFCVVFNIEWVFLSKKQQTGMTRPASANKQESHSSVPTSLGIRIVCVCACVCVCVRFLLVPHYSFFLSFCHSFLHMLTYTVHTPHLPTSKGKH